MLRVNEPYFHYDIVLDQGKRMSLIRDMMVPETLRVGGNSYQEDQSVRNQTRSNTWVSYPPMVCQARQPVSFASSSTRPFSPLYSPIVILPSFKLSSFVCFSAIYRLHVHTFFAKRNALCLLSVPFALTFLRDCCHINYQ